MSSTTTMTTRVIRIQVQELIPEELGWFDEFPAVTVREAEAFACFPRVSTTVTLIEKVPETVGVQLNDGELWEVHPAGRPE